MEAKDYTSVLRIADPARVNRGVPRFTRTGFCQKKRGWRPSAADLATKCADLATKCG